MNTYITSHRKQLLTTLTCLGLAAAMLACIIPGLRKTPTINLPSNSSNLLPEPSIGLAGLQSYQAVYNQTLKGSIDGKPFDRQSHMEYSLVTKSNDEEMLWQDGASAGPSVFRHTIRQGKAVYAQSEDGQDCWGGYEETPAETIPVPASLLPAVTKAGRVGDESVNGVAATHYHFDGNGISSDVKGASGEVWIAQAGGYVVKYTLTLPAPAQLTGKGVEVAETMSYELKDINTFEEIELPESCVPVLVNIPALEDAANLYRASGIMTYISQAELSKAVDFYTQALPPLGWTKAPEPLSPPAAGTETLEFTQREQNMTVYLDRSEGRLKVTVTLNDVAPVVQPQVETPGAAPTVGPKPTADASQSGLPEDVPLYPGATDLLVLPNVGVNFTTTVSAAEVAAFYREQLKSLNWDLQTELNPSTDAILQTWAKSSRMLMVSISVENNTTTVMLAMSNQ